MNLHTHQLYLLEQLSESFKGWSAIWINTEGRSLIMKSSPDQIQSDFLGIRSAGRTIYLRFQCIRDFTHKQLYTKVLTNHITK